MKSLKKTIPIFLFAFPVLSQAQMPVNGFMQGKGKGAVALSYNSESYEDVYLVPQKVNGVPVFNKVTVQSTNLFATVGLSKKLDLQVNLPYIKSTGQASDAVLNNLGYQNERKGLQDISLYLKYNPFNFKTSNGNLALMAAVGVQTPLGNYRVDESLQSILAIGNRATQINTILIANYKFNKGLFLNASGGYSARNNNVPSAILGEFKAGYAGKKVYVDAYIAGQSSSNGTDILKEGFNGVFPQTRVNYSRVGVNLYVPLKYGIGISGGYSSYIAGRNLGASSGGYGALIFSF
jgi:hypothetical protein